MKHHQRTVLEQAQLLNELGLQVPFDKVLELGRQALRLPPFDDQSAQIILVVPHGMIPMKEQVRYVKLRMRRAEVDEQSGTRQKEIQRLRDLGQSGSLTSQQRDQLGHLQKLDNDSLRKWRSAPRDRCGYMANWPDRHFSHLTDVPTSTPYLIHEVYGSERGYVSGREKVEFDSTHDVQRALEQERRRGLTLAEGVAMAIHHPEVFEQEHHVDLLGSDMQVMNSPNGVTFQPRPNDNGGRSAFTYLSTRRTITVR
jgi:hypothetical protein